MELFAMEMPWACFVTPVSVHFPRERLEWTTTEANQGNAGAKAPGARAERTYLDTKYAFPYQPTSFKDWNSEVILGTAFT